VAGEFFHLLVYYLFRRRKCVPFGMVQSRSFKMKRNQLIIFFILLVAYALAAFLTYAFFVEQLAAAAGMPLPDMGMSNAVLGLASAGIVLVLYGLLGLAGFWFARKLGLPGIFSADGNWRRWFFIPLGLGLVCGVVLVIGDMLFAPINGVGLMVHPGFPVSILASLSAGVGEEIAFRGFLFGLWGLILNWLLKRFNGRSVALWVANLIAALAFAASHFGTVLVLTGATSLAELSPVLILEIFVLNGVIGIIAGQRYMKDGLVAAVGVHFWTDVVFHVIWGLVG
jgi:membrane protease YdiL (CAAX protease family)